MKISVGTLRKIIKEEIEAVGVEGAEDMSLEDAFKVLEKNPKLFNDPKVQKVLQKLADKHADKLVDLAKKRGMTPEKAERVVNNIPSGTVSEAEEPKTKKQYKHQRWTGNDVKIQGDESRPSVGYGINMGATSGLGLLALGPLTWGLRLGNWEYVAAAVGTTALGFMIDYLSQRKDIDPKGRPFWDVWDD